MPTLSPLPCFLFDNGSLRAESTLSLRRIAARLGKRLGTEVHPVSLLHSSGVDPGELGDIPARLLEPAIREFAAVGARGAVLLPLFFGPSGALTDYLPGRLAAIKREFPSFKPRLAEPLVMAGDDAADLLAHALAENVQEEAKVAGWNQPNVILVDHGSPLRAVTAVRNRVGERLCVALGNTVAHVGVASMERRAGPDYDFNEPLLERALGEEPFVSGRVIVALQFLNPGRHAGPNGDVAAICAAAEARYPELHTRMTNTVGESAAVLDLLERRYRAAVRSE